MGNWKLPKTVGNIKLPKVVKEIRPCDIMKSVQNGAKSLAFILVLLCAIGAALYLGFEIALKIIILLL